LRRRHPQPPPPQDLSRGGEGRRRTRPRSGCVWVLMLIDLRSDTVTKPDDEMRRAMAAAEVGDDVFGEDPTVNRLQDEAAELLGCEAALFVPSGTMGNQIALHLLARSGSEVICDARSHVFHFEMGAMAALSGLLPRTIASPRGQLDPQAVEAVIAPPTS